jgi:multicomponent Na+:H+ antiporter subunit D
VIVVLPILIPLLTAIVCMLAGRSRPLQRAVGLVGAVALLATAVLLLLRVKDGTILTHALGAWPAPFGIVFVADALAAIMVLLAGLLGVATAIYALADIDAARERWGFHPLLHILLMGVCGAFLTGDLFNLYVWFEVLLIASFVLLALGGTRFQMEAAIKYVLVNLVASALFLVAIGILYGLAGTVNMADLAVKLSGTDHDGLVTTVAMLFLVSFGIKAAVFPLFFWLPASYHTPPAAVSAIFAGLLTKVGVYALLRVFTLLFTQDVGYTHTVLLWVAVATMVTGVLGAVAQDEVRRILSFHIVSQIGYMVLGLAFFTPLAVAGAIFYIAHHILVKANLFFVAGAIQRFGGSFRLDRLGGLAVKAPLLAILFLVPALSLAGVPPLSGFWSKLLLLRAGLEGGHGVAVAVALAVGLVTLLSMSKIWTEAFWKPRPATAATTPAPTLARATLLGPVAGLAVLTILIGLFPSELFRIAQVAGDQLMSRQPYLDAVLGAAP